MKTLANAADLNTIRRRIASLTAADNARWGSMYVGGMICHLTDSYKFGLGEKPAALLPPSPIPLPMLKWIALRAPMKWPKGVPTLPEVKQGVGGTPPAEFAADLAALLDSLDRFAACLGPWPRHPIFRDLTQTQWMRWGYLHADHHLRQFGR